MNGLEITQLTEWRSVAKCADCGRQEYVGEGNIRHARNCATPKLQFVAPKQVEEKAVFSDIIRDARIGEASRHSEESILAAVAGRYISVSDAMNRDF